MLNFQSKLKVIHTVFSFEKCQWTGIVVILHEHDEGYACSLLETEYSTLLKMINCPVCIKSPASNVCFLLIPFPITAVQPVLLFLWGNLKLD